MASGRERLPSQRRDRPGLAPGSLAAHRYDARTLAWPAVRSFVRLWLPVVAWAAVIFALSAIPALSSGLGAWDVVLRKAAHITEFAILGALLVRAIGLSLPAFVAGLAYAVTDEWHQSFVRGREGTSVDVAIDAVGVLIGILAWRRLRRASDGRRAAAPREPTTSHAP